MMAFIGLVAAVSLLFAWLLDRADRATIQRNVLVVRELPRAAVHKDGWN